MAIRRFQVAPRAFAAAVVAFTLLPLAELALLIWLGAAVLGFWATLLLCAATGFVGAWLARVEGLRAILKAQEVLASGRFPSEELFDGACVLIGGVLLLTPGLITDTMGLLLLVRPTRAALRRKLRRWWERKQGIIEV